MEPQQQSSPPSYPTTTPPHPERKNESLKNKIKSVSSTLLLIIIAPLLALFLTAHVFQPYEVDGTSMETTLQNADRLIVYKLPKTFANLTNGKFIPNRWDVVVFDRPKSLNAPDSTEHLIKRVIGLPGERVLVQNGTVTVYNEEFPEGFNPDSDKEYSRDILSTNGSVDITVGSEEIFVLGDNRSNSSDSRVFGAIQSRDIVGRATARFIPINAMKKL